MKTLVLDIETRPSLGYVWSLWDQNVSLSQLVEVGDVICFGAKWLDKKKVIFKSVHHHSKEEMVQEAWNLMDEADAIIHYNGRAFDIKHLNREFLLMGLKPPSPHKDIDLLTVTRRKFKFLSNKLQHVASELGIGEKVEHSGFQLWVDCMADDKSAWKKMREYCEGDVLLTEELYYVLRPWDTTHPSVPLYNGEDKDTHHPGCKNCGSHDLQRRGYAFTSQSKFQRFVCKECGTWGRTTSRESGVNVTNVIN